jgi:hypothetical protein
MRGERTNPEKSWVRAVCRLRILRAFSNIRR